MGVDSIQLLASRFIDATVDKWGTDEEAVFSVLKDVYAKKSQDIFEQDLRQHLSQETVQKLLQESHQTNIVSAILHSELKGAALNRAQDYYQHGKDRCTASPRDNFLEGALSFFDASSTVKKWVFGVGIVVLGVVTIAYPPAGVLLDIVAGGILVVGAIGKGAWNAVEFDLLCRESNDKENPLIEQTKDSPIVSANPPKRISSDQGRHPLPKPVQSVEQILYKGVMYSLDSCFESLTQGTLPADDSQILPLLEKLSECERGHNPVLAGYYYHQLTRMLSALRLPNNIVAERYRSLAHQHDNRLDMATSSPEKALAYYSESLSYEPSNDVIRDGLMVGIKNMLFDETADFLRNAADALIYAFKNDYAHSQDINRAFLEAQKYMGETYRAESDPQRKARVDELYKYLMTEKYHVLCEQDYQYRKDYCEYLDQFIKEFKPGEPIIRAQ